MNVFRTTAAVAIALGILVPAVLAAEQQPLPSIKVADPGAFSVAMVLEENVGRQVEVTISNGATFKGRLAGVGARAIHLSELVGKEFYDAVIDKSAIVAVVLRTRDRQ